MLSDRIHIGCSGWNYDGWKGIFYPGKISQKNLLPCYAEHFATVEVNNTFYQLPSAKSVRAWAAQTPGHFIFACKAGRYITHMKKLTEPEIRLPRMFDALEPLGAKLGPILFQLPPGWRVNRQRLAEFLGHLPRRHRYAFELRNRTWLCDDVYELLAAHDAALCFYDFKGFQSPEIHTASFVYVRLHGPLESPYQGSYDGRTLSAWARKFLRWAHEGREVYCYFDNDQKARAPFDARELIAKIHALEKRGTTGVIPRLGIPRSSRGMTVAGSRGQAAG